MKLYIDQFTYVTMIVFMFLFNPHKSYVQVVERRTPQKLRRVSGEVIYVENELVIQSCLMPEFQSRILSETEAM